MRNKLFITLSLVIYASAVFAQDTVTFSGNVIGDTKGFRKMIVQFNKGLPEDSTFLNKDGSFNYKFPYRPGVAATIYMEYDIKVRQRLFPFVIISDGPGKLQLQDADIKQTLHSGKLSGVKTAVDYLILQKNYTDENTKINTQLAARFPGQNMSDFSYRRALDSAMTSVTTSLVKQFVNNHSDSYAAVAAMRSYSVYIDQGQIEAIFKKIAEPQRNSTEGKAIVAHMEGLKKSAIGSKVADFSLPDPKGQAVSFNSLKGKYVLIDFWASWCGPCKASFPHLKEFYAKYKGDQFEILGISIDQDKQAWLNELPKQDLPWLQVLDDQSLAKKTFAIVGVPTTYLVSPQGIIIAKEIGFQEKGEIQMKLKEVLKDQVQKK